MKHASALVAATALFALVAADATAQSRGRVRAAGENGAVAAGVGPQGGAFVRGRGAVQNPDGSTTAAGGGAARGPNGGRVARGATTTVNPDGSATRRGAVAAQGPNGGSGSSTGSATRNADGTYSGARNTAATGSQAPPTKAPRPTTRPRA